MGDFNIDMQTNSNRKWQTLIQLFDLSQLISQPTRVTETSSTIIDHIYTSNPDVIVKSFVSNYAISDHFPVCTTRKINYKIVKSEHIMTSYRCYKHFNENAFLNDLSSDLDNFTTTSSNINDDISEWYNIVLKHLDNHAPIKVKRVKTQRLPDCYNQDIETSRKQRDFCKRRHQWAKYKKHRNKTKSLIRKAKREHFSKSVTNSRDTRTIWQHLRKATNKANTSNNRLPDEINIDNHKYTSPKDVATQLNEYFTSISDIFNDHGTDALSSDLKELKSFINHNVPDDVFFKIPFITPEQVSTFIAALDASKATGLDGLGPRIIKKVGQVLSPSIAALINKSIQTGVFPDQLKCAKVFPIYKSGNKSDPGNYRPISILPTISKIFERHINKHLTAYLNKYNLIHESQSGFRQRHSCQTALVKLIDQWMASIDKGDTVGALFIDFRKAFDLVDHNILISKLSAYKFNNMSLKWFTSYLKSRQQAIDSGLGFSSFSTIKSGVPQGSILGTTLFLLFINDLPLMLKYCFSDLFADDLTIHTNSPDISVINSEIQTDLDRTKTWGNKIK